ncbi:hypothetical protein WKW50_25265 [Ochrobactrum sp. GPK 3]
MGRPATFLTDGRVGIDSNRVENLILPISHAWLVCLAFVLDPPAFFIMLAG